MSCNKCKPPVDDCFEIDKVKCDEGCDLHLSTDCIFHTTYTDGFLPNIGIKGGSSLRYILKQIDKKLGMFSGADFSVFNLHDLNLTIEIKTLQQFAEAITKLTEELKLKDADLETDITAFSLDVDDINEAIDNIIKIAVSNSTLGINNTDELKQVLIKIISYVEDIQIPVEKSFDDSRSIQFGGNNKTVLAEVKISANPGNTIVLNDDGLYSAHISTSTILNSINTNPELKELFKSLVTQSFPALAYDIMSSTNTPIKYINSLGDEVTVTAKANFLLKLVDVKNIITPPTNSLSITFKGIV